MNLQNVTLIGGPADGQRHNIDVDAVHTYAVAVIDNGDREVRYFEAHGNYPPMDVVCKKHIYFIRQVGDRAWVGVHRSIA